MLESIRLLLASFSIAALALHGHAEELNPLKKDAPSEGETPPPEETVATDATVSSGETDAAAAEDAPDLSVGTKAFDAASVEELFETYKAENERRARQREVAILIGDDTNVIDMGTIQADPYHIRNFDQLVESIDPKPRRRLQRLAELDPVAAANIQVTRRAEERFFAGEQDPGVDPNVGRTANVDFREVGSSIANALERAKKAMAGKKATDDQQELPTEQK